MTNTRVKAAQSQARLMMAINEAVEKHTTTSPMLLEDIVAVLGFAAGCAIAQADGRVSKRRLRQIATDHIDNGLQHDTVQARNSLILPATLQ